MEHLKIRKGAWVVVCDGAKALILENIGDKQHPELRMRDVFEQKNPSTADQGADRPGRSHPPFSLRSSSVNQTDWHDQAEEEFLVDLVAKLDRAVQDGTTKELVIVAPPRALGMVRRHYTPAIREALLKELDKDLVKIPIDQIEKHVLR